MRLECFILDFDGTFTLVDREAVPFLEGFRAGLAELLGAPVDAAWARIQARVEADPDRFGWEDGGRIVAPSHADPYIMATTVGQLVLRELGGYEDPAARRRALDGLYAANYPRAATVFRPDARAVVEAILRTGRPVYVVTNSMTVHVKAKLDELAPEGAERLTVRGDARKFVVADPEAEDPRFDALPDQVHLEGLGRPIFVRRGRYFDALRAIWDETGTGPERTLVCGDIFELDLAMPAKLGATIHMVGRPGTPDYERRAVEQAGGTLTEDLSGVLDYL